MSLPRWDIAPSRNSKHTLALRGQCFVCLSGLEQIMVCIISFLFEHISDITDISVQWWMQHMLILVECRIKAQSFIKWACGLGV